jgi:PAS domain S-box-containing protein
MSKGKEKSMSAAAELRHRAEEQLNAKVSEAGFSQTVDESPRLVHELQVHRIELEMQNAELRKARDEVEKSLEKYTYLYDIAPVGYFTLKRNGDISAVNLCGASSLGIERAKLLGRRFGQFVTEEYRPVFISFLGTVFISEGKEECEVALHNVRDLPLFVHIEAVAAASGEECHIALIDITKRKQAEEELLFANTLLRTQLEASLDGILVVGEDGKILSYNRRFVDMWHIPADVVASASDERALQSALERLVNPEGFLERVRYLYEHPEEKSHDEIDLIDGITFERYSAPLIDIDKRHNGRVWYFRDITKRKRAEEAFRQSEERFRQIFEQHKDAVMLLNSVTLAVIDANAAAEQLYGFTREELIKSGLGIFFNPGQYEEFVSFVGEVRSNGSAYLSNKMNVRKNGAKILVAIRGQLILLQGEEVVFCSFMDVTKKVQMEREAREVEAMLIHANKMASLGMLVSSIVHEINNPNNYIMSNASLLSATWKDAMEVLDEYAKEHDEFYLGGVSFSTARKDVPALLSGLMGGARRIGTIVNTLKDFVRQDGASLGERMDVGKAVRIAYLIVEHEIKKHTVNFYLNIEEKIPYVMGNAQQLEQVVINLVMNALNALPTKNGRMFVSVSHPEHSRHVEITVRDEGVGMPENVLARLSEPFFTTRRDSGGTGLGLFISRSIVEKHNGVMEFESEPGKGTTITVKLPITTNGR